MRYFAILILLALLGSNVSAQSTYYYKLTKKVNKGVTNTNVSGGQFITFTNNACYESDRKGFSVNHGRLDYKYSDSGIKTYVGGSYWGNHAVFLFKSDLSALNVKTEDGEIFVYKRATAPANVETCSLIRKKSSKRNNNNEYPSYSGVSGYPVSGGFNTSVSNSTRKTKDIHSNKNQPVKHTCPRCRGQKKIVHESYAPQFGYGGNDVKSRCNECGQYFLRSTGHSHITCPQCHGQGYFTTN